MMQRIIFTVWLAACSITCCSAQDALQDGLVLKYLVNLPTKPSQHPPLLIFLHGYGSDEKDLFSLKGNMPPAFLIVSARAPYALPGGGYQWYDFNSGDHGEKQVVESGDIVVKFISQIVQKYNADARQVYLMGFSQGAIMCYEVGLAHPALVRGIAVLSGRIPPGLAKNIAPKDKLKNLRVFISHGTADPRIKFEEGENAVMFLQKQSISPQFHKYAGMGHTIDRDVLNDLVVWLKQ